MVKLTYYGFKLLSKWLYDRLQKPREREMPNVPEPSLLIPEGRRDFFLDYPNPYSNPQVALESPPQNVPMIRPNLVRPQVALESPPQNAPIIKPNLVRPQVAFRKSSTSSS